MKVLISGGTGLVGSRLTTLLLEKGYEVAHLSRSVRLGRVQTFEWDIENSILNLDAVTGVDYIIHLAGSGVADGRWTAKRKKEITESRVKSSELIFKVLAENGHGVKAFVAASAVGYYGMDTGDVLCSEDSSRGRDFLSEVVVEWEASTSKIRKLGIPASQLRIGVVLDPHGGALGKMETPLKMGIGSPLGSGKQWVSWIHIDDLCRMIIYAMENQLNDVFNAVAPNPVTNKELTKAMAQALGRPLFMPNVPSLVLKALFGEMATMILGGNRVSSDKIETDGFEFSFLSIESSLDNLYL